MISKKDQKSIGVILDLLEEKDYSIRFHTIQLLRILITNKKHALQQAILAPMGIARLMDLLRENREIVRNGIHFFQNCFEK